MKYIYMLVSILLLGLVLMPVIIYSETIEEYIAQERALLFLIEEELERLKEIISQKEQINLFQQNNQNDLIWDLFNEKVTELESAYLESDTYQIDVKHQEIRYIFKDTVIVRDHYLFYDAMYDYYRRDFNRSREKLEYFTENFASSAKIRQSVALLRTIYIMNGHNREYIFLHNKFSQYADARSRFYLGQAYYNIRELAEAKSLFERLIHDYDYGLRSRIMIGLILFSSFQTEKAIDHFIELSLNTSSLLPYYDFVILSLARILGQSGDFQSSLLYYNEYLDITSNEVTDELYYEIALINRAFGDNEMALFYLNQIIEMPEKSIFYDDAIVMIASIKANQTGYDSSFSLINDVLRANRAYGGILEYEQQLLAKFRNDVESYINEPTANKRIELNRQYNELQELLDRNLLLDFSSLNREEQEYTKLINEEYVMLLKLITDINDVALRISSLPNDRRVAQIERQISDIDTLRVDLLTSKFLYSLTNVTIQQQDVRRDQYSFYSRYLNMIESYRVGSDQYMKALNIAREIVRQENQLEDPATGLTTNEKAQLRNRIVYLLNEVEREFGTIDEEDEYLILLNEELASLTQLRNGLSGIKGLVASSFHEKVATRMKRSNRNSFQGGDITYLLTVELMNKTRRDLDQINRKYDYALLDILFQENVRRDREYRSLIQQLEDEGNR
ncbi:MAG: hypothetical protein K0B81_05135 [Candidatus Cloacimonetes bacterium]|nr:hypothetical protein [Candidatus Cloacimonadota bacterium]